MFTIALTNYYITSKIIHTNNLKIMISMRITQKWNYK